MMILFIHLRAPLNATLENLSCMIDPESNHPEPHLFHTCKTKTKKLYVEIIQSVFRRVGFAKTEMHSPHH